MALSDRLHETPRRATGRPCSVAMLEGKLAGTAEGEAFHQMMYELGWSERKIWEAVTAEGHYLGRQTVNRHRSGACSCYAARSAS